MKLLFIAILLMPNISDFDPGLATITCSHYSSSPKAQISFTGNNLC